MAKDGSSQFNNVIVRGRVEATSGVFRGTVQADSFIGDIAVAKSYDSLTFRRNQTVQRNGAYQNRGYSMTVVWPAPWCARPMGRAVAWGIPLILRSTLVGRR
ncbi:hypothetical protein [Klebsiella pneumoniae]|uniref:hypothetical protein n=1 Tax=Klebsiella pneumoniae TaxID=573 RepID=UPI003AF3E632